MLLICCGVAFINIAATIFIFLHFCNLCRSLQLTEHRSIFNIDLTRQNNHFVANAKAEYNTDSLYSQIYKQFNMLIVVRFIVFLEFWTQKTY